MFTGESVATVLVPKIINSALFNTVHLQKNSAQHNLGFTPWNEYISVFVLQ